MEESLDRVTVSRRNFNALKLSTVMCNQLILFLALCFKPRMIASISRISVEAKNFEGVARFHGALRLKSTDIADEGFKY